MPRDSNGVYSLPNGYKAVTGQRVLASQHNPPLEDLASSMTNSLPRSGAAPMLGDMAMGGHRVTGAANGSSDDDLATVGQSAIIGEVKAFAGNNAPGGWLMCYGQAISRVSYAALFAVIGTTYGAGDGSSTFNLPDCRGRVIAGKDDMGGVSADRLTNQAGGVNGDALGASGGAETHFLTKSQMPSHMHGGTTGSAGAVQPRLRASASSTAVTANIQSTLLLGNDQGGNLYDALEPIGNHTHSITSEGGDQSHNNVQPTIVMNMIIRATY